MKNCVGDAGANLSPKPISDQKKPSTAWSCKAERYEVCVHEVRRRLADLFEIGLSTKTTTIRN